MKKTIIILCIILIGVFGILTFLSQKDDFAAEKMLWKADRQFAKMVKSTESFPDQAFERLAGQYRAVITRFPDSKFTPQTHIILGRVYLIKKDYEKAKEIFSSICPKFPNNRNICALAMVSVGKVQEAQGNWEEAEKIYKEMIQKYPQTEEGLSGPLYIAKYYENKGNQPQATLAYNNAIIHYREMLNSDPSKNLEFKLLGLLSNCYMSAKRWNQALDALSLSLRKYPHPQTAEPILKSINIISLTQLKDKQRAINLYQDILDENPKHPLAQILKQMIEKLDVVEEADADVTLKP